jgi:nitronate monooxygenase
MVTDAYSGRSARARRTRYALDMESSRMRLPDFPAMYALSGPLSEAQAAQESGDFAFHLYGQAAVLNRELPAAELMRLLVAETASVFGSLGASVKDRRPDRAT